MKYKKETIFNILESIENEKGVNFRKDRNKWRSYIVKDEKQIALGHYDTKEEAIIARKEYIKQIKILGVMINENSN